MCYNIVIILKRGIFLNALIMISLCLMFLSTNIFNIYRIFKIRHRKKYLSHMSVPTITGVLFFIISFGIGKIRGFYSDGFELFLIICSVLSIAIFAIITSVLVIVKAIIDREYEHIEIMILYGIISVICLPISVMVTLIGYILRILFKNEKKAQVSIVSYY